MASPKNIVAVRTLLAQKFPGLKISPVFSRAAKPCWPTGWTRLDDLLGGGLAKGAVTELVAVPAGSGGATVLRQLLLQSSQTGSWTALIDGQDSFDPSPFTNATLSRLLWIRCHTANESLKCADLLLRDRNLPLVILDLALSAPAQLRKLSPSVWYRFQRLIEGTSTVFLVITPTAMVSHAETRIALEGELSIRSLAQSAEEFWRAFHAARLDPIWKEEKLITSA